MTSDCTENVDIDLFLENGAIATGYFDVNFSVRMRNKFWQVIGLIDETPHLNGMKERT